MLADEPPVHSDRWGKIDRDLDSQKAVVNAMFQYRLELFVRQAGCIIGDDGDFPWL